MKPACKWIIAALFLGCGVAKGQDEAAFDAALKENPLRLPIWLSSLRIAEQESGVPTILNSAGKTYSGSKTVLLNSAGKPLELKLLPPSVFNGALSLSCGVAKGQDEAAFDAAINDNPLRFPIRLQDVLIAEQKKDMPDFFSSAGHTIIVSPEGFTIVTTSVEFGLGEKYQLVSRNSIFLKWLKMQNPLANLNALDGANAEQPPTPETNRISEAALGRSLEVKSVRSGNF